MPRSDRILSEDDLEAETQTREKRIAAEDKLDSLRHQRYESLRLVDRLSEEIMALQSRRQALNEEVQKIHDSFREFGNKQRQIRETRKRLLDHLDELMKSLRHEKGEATKGRGLSSRSISAEIARLEREQQTRVMSLKDENALIDKIRHMRAEMTERETVEAEWMKVESEATSVKQQIQETRQKLQEANVELDGFHKKRDEAMAKVQQSLTEVGHILSEIRSKGKVRTEALDKARATGDEMQAMGREVLDLERESRKRISEARSRLAEHGAHHRTSFNEGAREKAADDLLSALLKNGKIEIGVNETDPVPAGDSVPGDKDSRRRRA